MSSKHVRKLVNFTADDGVGAEADVLKLNYDLSYLDVDERRNMILSMRYIIRLQAYWRGFLVRRAMRNLEWVTIAKFNTNVDQRAFFNVKVFKTLIDHSRTAYKMEVSNDATPDDNLIKIFGNLPPPAEIKRKLILKLGDDYMLTDFDLIG